MLKHAPDGSVIFFFPDYVNEIPLLNPGLRLYKCRGLTFEQQPMEVAHRSSVSWRITRSMSWNAAMDMPPPPPHAFHGYAGGSTPAEETFGSSSGYQSSWDKYVPQPEAGGSSWQTANNSEWEHPSRTNWGYSGSSSSSGAPPLFAARRSCNEHGTI